MVSLRTERRPGYLVQSTAVACGAILEEEPPPQLEARDIMSKGPIELTSGLAQIEFYNGARALVEGPAKLELLDEGSVFLTSGRLRAQIPPQAQSLRVFTPQAELVVSESLLVMLVGPKTLYMSV